MKSIHFILALLVISFSLEAQDIDYENINIEYTRLPLKPVDKSIKNYQASILLEYLAKSEQKKLEYEQKIKDADADFALQQKEYKEKLQKATIQHQKDLLAWVILSPLNQQSTPRPEMPVIPLPSKKDVGPEPFEITPDVIQLANSKIALEGFNKLQDQPLIITIFLNGFEFQSLSVQHKTVDKKVNNVSVPTTTYNYYMSYKHIIKSKVLSPVDGLIMDEVYNPSLTFQSYKSKEFLTQAELEQWWTQNYKSEMTNIQESIINENLNKYNSFLNNIYGYKKVNRAFSISFIDEKTNYEDYKDAFAQAKTGYTLIGNASTYASGVEYIKKAIAIWEKAMLESNPKNKKARIDEDVTEATLYNLAEAYSWINEFPKALEYLNKLQTFKLSNKEKTLALQTNNFIADQQVRAINNK